MQLNNDTEPVLMALLSGASALNMHRSPSLFLPSASRSLPPTPSTLGSDAATLSNHFTASRPEPLHQPLGMGFKSSSRSSPPVTVSSPNRPAPAAPPVSTTRFTFQPSSRAFSSSVAYSPEMSSPLTDAGNSSGLSSRMDVPSGVRSDVLSGTPFAGDCMTAVDNDSGAVASDPMHVAFLNGYDQEHQAADMANNHAGNVER